MVLNGYKLGEGPPVVILHGLFGSSENWRTVARSLSEDFCVAALDLRNHGDSAHSPQMSYMQMATDVLHTIDDYGLDRVHMIGHSMGGKTAMQFALSFPDRVSRLVIVDMAPRAYPPTHRRILDALCALDPERLHSRKQALERLKEGVPDARVRRFLAKNLVPGENGGYRWRINLEAIRASYPQIAGPLPATDLYEGPALFIRGIDSEYVRDADLETVRAFFLDAEIVSLPGGHWVHADATDDFVKAVREFLM